MAFVPKFCASFEQGNDDYEIPYLELDADSGVTTGSKKNGSYGMSVDSTDGIARWDAIEDLDWDNEIYISVWQKIPSGSPAAGGIAVWDISEPVKQVHIELRSDGKYQAFVDGISVATGTEVVTHTDWNNIQVRFKLDNSSGIIQVKVNGTLDIDYSGDTQPGSGDYIAYFGLTSGGNNQENYFDDLMVGLGGWPGEVESELLEITSDDDKNWTPSTGTDHYALLDEFPESDLDYVESSTDNQVNSFGTSGGFSDTDKEIIAFVTNARCQGSDYLSSIEIGVKKGSSYSYYALPTDISGYAYASYQGIRTNNPETSAPWDTDTQINAAKPAIKSVIT